MYFSLKLEKINIEKNNLEVLQALLDKLQLCQQVLGFDCIVKIQLITLHRGYVVEFLSWNLRYLLQ